MSPYDADGERIDPRDVLDRDELADYQRSRQGRAKGTRRYVRAPRHTDDINDGTTQAENTYQAPPRESA